MAEHKKLSMLVKLDDGQTYTLGGDGADNAVTLDTEQTITGLKTFDKLPQSSVEPKADADLITKGYADGHYLPVDTKPHKYDILVKMKHDGNSWVGFSDFSVRLRDGTRLDIKHIENQSATTATKPVKAVFKTVKDLKANIESPTQQLATFFDSYKLEAGEFTGTVSFFKVVGKFGPASRDINPWYVYVGNGNANNYDGIYAVSIDNLDKPLLGVNFKFGDAHNSESYTCLQCGVVFTVDGSALEVAYDGDMSNAFETTIEYPINAQSMIGVVKVDNAQEITGAKTFTQNIKITAKPSAPNDVATVGYVSGLLNAKAPYDVTLDFKVEDDTDGGWVVYSNMEINLDNGKKLKCIHIDNTQPTSANAPVKAVFKAIPATEAINAAPAEQAPTFFDTYQLQDEEYLGTLTYGHILNSQLQDYASYKGPFHTNQYGTTCTIKEATQLRISISELPAAVSKVSLKFDSSYLPKTFKASMSGVGMDVTSNVLTNPSGNTPLELLFDVVKLTGLVTLDTAQTITGAKTFEKLPKSEATPKDDADLITKAYLDERCPIPKSSLLFQGSAQQMSYYLEAWIAYKDLRLSLANGQYLVPVYLEDTAPQQATEPVKVVYKLTETEYVAKSVVRKENAFFDTYVLKDGELLGYVTYTHLLDKKMRANPDIGQATPFDQMLNGVINVDYDLHPLIEFTFEKLNVPLSQITLTVDSYAPATFKVTWVHDNNQFVSKLYTLGEPDFSKNTPINIALSSSYANLVTTNTQQELTALKTFKVLPQSEAVPADDKDLVNKKYVDEKVGAGGGTGGAAPANMVTTDTAQNITEVKTFDKLPKSSVEPTDDTELVNKKYVDDASKKVVTLADAQTISGVKTFSALPQSSVEPATDTDLVNKKYVDAKVGGGGAAGGNVMTLDTEQTVTAVKQFDKFPRLSDNYAYILPTDPKEFVNKAYVDNATTVNNGYALNIYGTLEASGKKIFISNMEITLQNGEKLVLRYSASDAKPGQSASTRVLWSYGDTGKTYGSLESLDGSRIGSYQCNSQEIKGYIKTGGQLRVENKYNFSPAEMIFTGTSTDEHQLVSFEFEGSFPPIARVAFRSSTGDLKGKSLRFESIVKGHNKGAEYPIQNVAETNQYNLPINPAFVPEPYYLNRFDEQYIQGIYHYQVMPMLDKPVAMFSKANANTPAAMGDFLQSIAIPVPKTQVLVFENRATKTNIGDKPPYRYKWDINLQIGDLKLTRKRPSDLQEEELFLKFCGPSSDGYKGVLTTKKPENYLNPVVEKQQHEMDAYKLEAGECWCKLAYNTQRGGMFSDENLAYNEKQGSNKLKDLFLPKTVWFNASETEYNWNENGGPKADVRLLIFDSAMISWTVQKEGCSNNYQSLELRGDRTKKNYSEYLLKQNPQPVFVHDVPDLQLQTTNVLAIIQALQDRVKALEDAAPKP
ncbi:MAG: hypothetical protein Q4A68_00245 [Anaerobiospirillum succiniciproducens]|uniref:hypothetical protein n=1 Tax=Anaerobiospirillum succiniciproducens TaxID=13335 RepID=UPI0026DAE618|nr:hypothetical protein [Anaerobiospirillum succiniciproducens]MDO4675011.1 hypothetical protein [Anaerobiospirillum succiniciproducens]